MLWNRLNFFTSSSCSRAVSETVTEIVFIFHFLRSDFIRINRRAVTYFSYLTKYGNDFNMEKEMEKEKAWCEYLKGTKQPENKNHEYQLRNDMREDAKTCITRLLLILQKAEDPDLALIFFNPKTHDELIKPLYDKLKNTIEEFKADSLSIFILARNLERLGIPFKLEKLMNKGSLENMKKLRQLDEEIDKLLRQSNKEIAELLKSPGTPENVMKMRKLRSEYINKIRKLGLERINIERKTSKYFKRKLCQYFMADYGLSKKDAQRLVDNQFYGIPDSTDRYPTLFHQMIP
jgi:hypothetical protein